MIRSLPAWTLAGAFALAVSLGAQGATDQSAQKSATKGMTLTGCLQAGTAPGTFTLTNATSSQRASADKPTDPATATPTPTEEAVGTSGKAKTYELTAKTGVDLTAHVGHKVEVTTEPATAKGAEAGTSTEMKTATPKLTVTALKHVSPTCP